MKTINRIVLVLIALDLLAAPLAAGQGGKTPSRQVQETLIALDKLWGEAESKGDTASLNKILSDTYVGLGSKGQVLGKQDQVAAGTAGFANLQNASYTADEYKFEALTPDVIVMTHRATIKGVHEGKEVTESHRSLHVFQKRGGQWQVVVSANRQLPIAQ